MTKYINSVSIGIVHPFFLQIQQVVVIGYGALVLLEIGFFKGLLRVDWVIKGSLPLKWFFCVCKCNNIQYHISVAFQLFKTWERFELMIRRH